MEIKKNNYLFYINKNDKFSKKWFENNKLDVWEKDTFHILEYYKNNKNGIYIDIGSWIGPTVLYSAIIYKKVIAIEPDPVAIKRLKKNIACNNFTNISLVEKGLSCENGTIDFGGNGDFGNSESTMLISNKEDFLSYKGRHTKKNRDQNQIVKIETITIEKLIEEQNIKPKNISLIKMDIEGGEKIVIPSIIDFLKKYKPVFYISLHYCFLRKSEIQEIIDILFNIYDKCYFFNDNGVKKQVDKKKVEEKSLKSLVFE